MDIGHNPYCRKSGFYDTSIRSARNNWNSRQNQNKKKKSQKLEMRKSKNSKLKYLRKKKN